MNSNRFQTIYASKETGRWGIFDHQYDLGITGLVYVQDIASATWVFRHNLNQLPFLIEFFKDQGDGSRIDFVPSDVQINNNVITVTVGEIITGTIVVVFTQPVEFSLPSPTLTPTPTVTPSSSPSPTPTLTPTVTPTSTMPPTPSPTPTTPVLIGRAGHSMIKFGSNKYLIAGGFDNTNLPIASAFIYHSDTNTMEAVGSMNVPRAFYGSIVLTNGKVLIAGGSSGIGSTTTNTAELFDPVAKTFTLTGSMNDMRQQFTMMGTAGIFILAAGGYSLGGSVISNSELYDEGTGTWTATVGSMPTGRFAYVSANDSLGDPNVIGGNISNTASNSILQYDINTQTWSTAIQTEISPRYNASVAHLNPANSTYLISGGADDPTVYNTAEYYVNGTPTSIESLMSSERTFHASTAFTDNTVLVTGGRDSAFNVNNTADLFDWSTDSFTQVGNMMHHRMMHTSILLETGEIILTGGVDENGNTLATTEIYNPVSKTFRNGPTMV